MSLNLRSRRKRASSCGGGARWGQPHPDGLRFQFLGAWAHLLAYPEQPPYWFSVATFSLHKGALKEILVPLPGEVSTDSSPPSFLILSSIEIKPNPSLFLAADASKPTPSSFNDPRISAPVSSKRISAFDAWACRVTFLSPSLRT